MVHDLHQERIHLAIERVNTISCTLKVKTRLPAAPTLLLTPPVTTTPALSAAAEQDQRELL